MNLKIVFISREKTVMSLLEDLSATNMAVIYEVGDVKDEEGIEYLMKNGTSQLDKDPELATPVRTLQLNVMLQ